MSGKHDPALQAGAPGSIDLGGRTYAVAQASDADLMEVRRRLKKAVPSPLKMYAALVQDADFRKLPKRVRDDLAREAGQMRLRGETPLTAELVADLLQEPEHCAYLAWVLIRKLHPDVTYEGLRETITPDNATRVFLALHEASGMESLGN